MLTVACVLKSGGDYGPQHVAALHQGVERHLTLPHRFVCLSDVDVPCERIPLRNNWPGWWSKIELFRPGLFWGPVLYFDLDTIIVGSLDEIALGHRFTVLRNFWAKKYSEPQRIGSGVMAWDIDLAGLYCAFAADPDGAMKEYKTRTRWGDQGFIRDVCTKPMDRWQDKHPGKVVSYKLDVYRARGVPKEAAVVAFHGKPRPWKLPARERKWFEIREKEAA